MKRVCAALFVLHLAACSPAPEGPHYDVLITGGIVYDGSAQPGRPVDLAIVGDRIATVDPPAGATADVTIDARGKLVVPGFIDPHTHAPVDTADFEATAHINFLTQGVTTVVVGNDGAGIEERAATLARLTVVHPGTNVAFFAGHGQIRNAVMGYADREPSAAELDAMQWLLAQELDAGALGLSTGLFYAPGSYASTEEVVELARTAARRGGIYETHLRDESSYTVGLIAAVEEAIRIGREAGIPVHISHIKALGRDVWGESADVIALVAAAREAGVEVTANQYPWEASGVMLASALIPRWAMAGSRGELHARLRDAELLPQIRTEMRNNLERRGGPGAMLIASVNSEYRGSTLADVALRMERDPVDAAIALVLAENPKVASFVMRRDDIDAFRVQPWVMTGSDGGSGHPRFYATYPKAWRDYVIDRKLLTPEQFIHRSTGLVADTLRLCGRGYLRPGYAADVAVIDPEKFLPKATYVAPEELSAGVDRLLVNGELVIDGGEVLGRRAGLILRKNAADCDG